MQVYNLHLLLFTHNPLLLQVCTLVVASLQLATAIVCTNPFVFASMHEVVASLQLATAFVDFICYCKFKTCDLYKYPCCCKFATCNCFCMHKPPKLLQVCNLQLHLWTSFVIANLKLAICTNTLLNHYNINHCIGM